MRATVPPKMLLHLQMQLRGENSLEPTQRYGSYFSTKLNFILIICEHTKRNILPVKWLFKKSSQTKHNRHFLDFRFPLWVHFRPVSMWMWAVEEMLVGSYNPFRGSHRDSLVPGLVRMRQNGYAPLLRAHVTPTCVSVQQADCALGTDRSETRSLKI